MPSEYIDVLDPVVDHNLNRGLVAWWLGLDNLSGGVTLYDIVRRGASRDGTLTGGALWIPDPCDPQFGGVYLDGSNDYIALPAATRPTGYPLTLIAVVSSRSTTAYQPFFSIANATSTQILARLALRGDVAGDPAELVVSSGAARTARTSTGYAANTLVHVAGVIPSVSTRSVYLNGGGKATESTSTGSPSPTAWNLGADAAAGSLLSGNVYVAWCYDRALSDDEIQQHYAQWLARYPDTLRRVPSRAWILGVAQDTPTTAVPGTANGQGTCTTPTITQLYTATPGTAAGTSSVVAPTVILVYTVTPGTATGQGACDDVTVTHGTLTVTPGTASGTGSCTDVTVTQLFTATPGTADGTGTCVDVTTTFGPLTVTPGVASGTGTCTDVSVTLGTLTVTPGTANGQGTCIDVVLSTFEPGIASATSDCVAPSVIQVYTTTPGTADGTGTCTSPTVTFGPVSITPGIALGTGTCTDVTPTFGPLSISPGTASGTGTCVDIIVNSATTATPGTASATGTCTDVTVSEVYYAVPGTAIGQGACVDISVTHGALVVTPGVTNAQGQCTKVRVSGPSGSGGGSKLLLMGAS